MSIKKGEKLPQTTFMNMSQDGPSPLSNDDLFTGKKVVLLSVPGAFTPTCSARHLPGFVENAEAFRAKGVDTIACVSVNDVFVMHAWGEQQNVGSDVVMLADGNGTFSDEIGLSFDGSGFGMGKRAQRYAMVVNDGVVEDIFVEDAGEFKVSSAQYVLDNL